MNDQSKKTLKTIGYVILGLTGFSIIGQMLPDTGSTTSTPSTSQGEAIARNNAEEDSIAKARAVEDSLKMAEAVKMLKRMKVKKDEFEDVAFYYGNNIIPYINTSRIYLYMPYKEGGRPGLRMKIQYSGEDWIFWNEAEVKVDGEKFNLYGMGSVKRDNDGGEVWETTDSQVGESGGMDGKANLEVIRKIANSKKTLLRLSGKYRKDRTITSSEKKAMKEVLEVYDAFSGI